MKVQATILASISVHAGLNSEFTHMQYVQESDELARFLPIFPPELEVTSNFDCSAYQSI